MPANYSILSTLVLPDTSLYSHFPQNRQESWHELWSGLIIEKISYQSQGKAITGFIVKPKNAQKLPVIIYNRGGSKDFGQIEERQLFFLLARFASWGYVVVASQYSGNDGGEGKDECGGEDVWDVVNLQQVIESIPEADSERIGMYGGSRGGMQTFLALEKMPNIKAVSVKAGSANQLRGYASRPELKEYRRDMYDVDSQEENLKRSVAFRTQYLPKNVPILLQHGTGDEAVSVLDALELASQLTKQSIHYKLIVYPEGDHKLSQYRDEHLEEIKKWFAKYL